MMSIGGADYLIEAPAAPIDLLIERVLDWAGGFWPDAVVESLEMDAPIGFRDALRVDWHNPTAELFLYENASSAEEWTRNGATDLARNRMIHCLFDSNFHEHGDSRSRLTLAVDELTPNFRSRFESLQRELQAELNSRLAAADSR
jgi:hypothetical protein